MTRGKETKQRFSRFETSLSPLRRSLIKACKERGVAFYYGISPGLDMGYSSPKDVADLKAKCDDLRSLGCAAFALLWDDIDTTLPKEDREAFRDGLLGEHEPSVF